MAQRQKPAAASAPAPHHSNVTCVEKFVITLAEGEEYLTAVRGLIDGALADDVITPSGAAAMKEALTRADPDADAHQCLYPFLVGYARGIDVESALADFVECLTTVPEHPAQPPAKKPPAPPAPAHPPEKKPEEKPAEPEQPQTPPRRPRLPR